MEYQGFEMEIIDDSVSEVSGISETLSIASITSSMENEDKVEEIEQFTKFWELFKIEFNNVISYKKITVESFEELMKINYEEGMNEKNIRKMGEGLSYLTKGLKYRRLIPNKDRIINWMMDMIICSKKFTLSVKETQRNYNKIVTKPQENEERSLSPDLSPVEKFLILYQNIVPEIEEINEEEVKKALEELLQLEYTASGKQVKAAQIRIIKAIRYEPAIVETEEIDRIRYILTCSNGLTLNIQQTQKNIRKYVAGSNVTTSEEMSPEKVGSPEKKGSDEEDDSERKKEEIIDGCKRCNRSWKDCTCQCRKHGYILDCGIEHDEECYYITIEEYEEYQKKSSIFQTLVKIGTYKWNGETYEMINKTKELEDSEEEEENKGTNEEQENTKPTIEDTYENIEYEEAETSTRNRTEDWVEKERQRMKEEHKYEELRKKLEEIKMENEKKRRRSEEIKRGNKNDDEFEFEEYEEKDIKRLGISSPFQHSENSENNNFQNIITPEESNTTTNTNTGTNTPSTQGSFNRLFSNPQTPPRVLTPPIQVVPPVINMADFTDQQFRNEQVRLQRLGEIDIEYFYGKDSENPIEWIGKIIAIADTRSWGTGGDGADIDADGQIKARRESTYLRGEALKWFNTLPNNSFDNWNTDGSATSFRNVFINAMWTEQKKENWFYELQEIRKGNGETVEEYARRFKQKKERADPTGTYPARFIANIFTKGLDGKNRGRVLMLSPTTLEEAIKHAKQAELVERTEMEDTRTIQEEVKLQRMNQQIQGNVVQETPMYQKMQKDVKDEEIEELTRKMERMEAHMANLSRNTNGRQMTRPMTGPRIQCRNCGKMGHMERECFRNQTCTRCNKRGHTARACREVISQQINYADNYDYQEYEYEVYYANDYDSYDNNDYDDYESYPALRSGKESRPGDWITRQARQEKKPREQVRTNREQFQQNVEQDMRNQMEEQQIPEVQMQQTPVEQKRTRIMTEEHKRRMAQNRKINNECRNCGMKGHFMNTCTAPKREGNETMSRIRREAEPN